MSNWNVLAIIPAYNEEKNIRKVIAKTQTHVSEICVVDDGSSDNTFDIVSSMGVTVLQHTHNRGKGAALMKGIDYFLETNHDIAIFLDGDGQHDPDDISKFLDLFMKNPEIEIIIGSRFGTKEWLSNMPFTRKISNLLSRFGMWILYNGLVIEDPQNGFRAYRREVLECISFKGRRYEAETEMLIDGYIKGFGIEKVRIKSSYNHEVVSHFSLLRDTWTIPGMMLKLFFKHKPFLLKSKELRRKNRNLLCKHKKRIISEFNHKCV